MNSVANRQRLLECFRAVFPDASEAELESATMETLSGWDSVAQVTLVSLTEEEFRIVLPPEKYGQLTSFAAFLESTEA